MKVRDEDEEENQSGGGTAFGGLSQYSGALSWGDPKDYLRFDEGGRY